MIVVCPTKALEESVIIINDRMQLTWPSGPTITKEVMVGCTGLMSAKGTTVEYIKLDVSESLLMLPSG